jgi:signal transduction histidine kinase
MLPHIFDLFAQESSGTGLGIGLAVVRGLVDRHGGTVEARSDGPGTGSEFIVRLPAVR